MTSSSFTQSAMFQRLFCENIKFYLKCIEVGNASSLNMKSQVKSVRVLRATQLADSEFGVAWNHSDVSVDLCTVDIVRLQAFSSRESKFIQKSEESGDEFARLLLTHLDLGKDNMLRHVYIRRIPALPPVPRCTESSSHKRPRHSLSVEVSELK